MTVSEICLVIAVLVHSIFIMQLGRQVNDLEFKIAMLKCSIEMMKKGGANDEAD